MTGDPAEARLLRQLHRAARQVTDQQTDRLAQIPGGRDLIVTVTAATPLTVSWHGLPTPAAGRLAAYTAPAVGDRVLCRVVHNQLIVLDKIV